MRAAWRAIGIRTSIAVNARHRDAVYSLMDDLTDTERTHATRYTVLNPPRTEMFDFGTIGRPPYVYPAAPRAINVRTDGSLDRPKQPQFGLMTAGAVEAINDSSDRDPPY